MASKENDPFDFLGSEQYSEVKDPLRLLGYLTIISGLMAMSVIAFKQSVNISNIFLWGMVPLGIIFFIYKLFPRTCSLCKKKMKSIKIPVYTIMGQRDKTIFCCENCKTKITTKIKTSENN